MRWAGAASALALLLAVVPAQAERFWRPQALLAAFFEDSEVVRADPLVLTPEERIVAEAIAKEPLSKEGYTIYVALSGARVDGLALLDEVPGLHEAIGYGVQLDPNGVVRRQEVMTYNERRGGEVRMESFREQFVGKSASDPVRVGVDIDGVSGATISSRAMATGVRRSLALAHVWRARHALVSDDSREAAAGAETPSARP